VNTTDLAHGFVVGDWQEQLAKPVIPYPARLGELWNGFANPFFDWETASRVITDQKALLGSLPSEDLPGLYSLAWKGDAIVVSTLRGRGRPDDEPQEPWQVEPVDIDGEPHWDLGFGWTWQQVTQDGEPVTNDATTAQRNAYSATGDLLACARMSLRLEPGMRTRTADGSDVISIVAHLGGFEDQEHKPIPVYVQIGTVTIAPDGATVVKLEYQHQLHPPTA
jgi:hypothetical protein